MDKKTRTEPVESKDSAVLYQPASLHPYGSQGISGAAKLMETLWKGVVDSFRDAIINCRLTGGERGTYPKRPGKGRQGTWRK